MQNETSFELYLKALGFVPKPTFFEPDTVTYEGLDVVASGLRYEDQDLDPNKERFRLDRIYLLHTNTCHIEVLDNIIRDMLHFLEDSVKFIDTGGETYCTKTIYGTMMDPAYIIVRKPNPYVDKFTACVYDKTFAYARFQSTGRMSFLQYGISQAGGLKTLDPLSKEFVQAMRAELQTVIQKLKGIREDLILANRGIEQKMIKPKLVGIADV
jgi:hypothetical protein